MFHGGTNFGLTNGANDKGTYRPIVTSYDYDAPLDEAGNPTAKYWAFREVLARYARGAAGPSQRPRRPAPAFAVRLSPGAAVVAACWSSWAAWHRCDEPVSADELGQAQGLTLYRAAVDAPAAQAVLCRSARSGTGRRCS